MTRCEHTAMDSYDHNDLCEAQIYDASGKTVRYLETRYNEPDLWALAKAIEYARKPEPQTLLAYVSNAKLADKLISSELTDAGDGVQVKKQPDGSEIVTMGWGQRRQTRCQIHA